MLTIIFIFILSFALSLVLTPFARKIAHKHGIVDIPSKRKVHTVAIPRIGGVAIYLAFFLPLASGLIYSNYVLDFVRFDFRNMCLFLGATTMFLTGLADDYKGVRPRTKLMLQILSALLAFSGGIRIDIVFLPIYEVDWTLGLMLSVPATVLWFVLVINAINLIDGLDGLAAGITLFVSLFLLFLCLPEGRLLVATGLAALAGTCLGFLRYNFNPASIFMGDSGSYFLGFMLAALTIIGSVKSQAAAAMLIPAISLGLPLMDTIWAPVRRFLLGRKIFQPDSEHLHHRLLKYGLTHRKAVLVLYGVSVLMGAISLLLVNARDDRAAMLLLVIGISFFIGFRKLGYFDYLGVKQVYGWIRDVSDEAGISNERRTFLNHQLNIGGSKKIGELWPNVCAALGELKFDMAQMHLENISNQNGKDAGKLTWTRNGFDIHKDICKECMMKLELPLISEKNDSYGTLWLIKDLKLDSISHYTLRRVEHLRRTVIGVLEKIHLGNPT